MPYQLPFSFILIKMSRKRSGVSPVIGSTIILGITVALGLALWSFANSGVNTATKQYADSVTDYSKLTTDRFVVPSVAFDYANGVLQGASADDITVFVYNSGRFETQILSVLVTCKDCAPAFNPVTLVIDPSSLGTDDLNFDGITQANESIDGKIPSKSIMHLSFNSSAKGAVFTPGFTYQVQVIADSGAYQTVYQKY